MLLRDQQLHWYLFIYGSVETSCLSEGNTFTLLLLCVKPLEIGINESNCDIVVTKVSGTP